MEEFWLLLWCEATEECKSKSGRKDAEGPLLQKVFCRDPMNKVIL
jgi:hypothetical protein